MTILERAGLFGSAPRWGEPFQPSIAQRAEALRRLAGPSPNALRRLIRDAKAQPGFFDHLWCVPDEDQSIAATVALAPLAGNTLHAMVTRAGSDGTIEPLGRLLGRALAGALGQGRALTQAVLEPSRSRDMRVLEAAGMARLATLGYYERALPRRGRVATSWPAGASITACDVLTAAGRAELSELLQQTYDGTLDCPGLAGLRTTEEILQGHLATHAVEPDLWSIVRLEGKPVAVSMCSPLPFGEAAELVYFGVASNARGLGIGPALLQHSLGRLEHRGILAVHLACDESNAPALRMYRNAGFERTVRRVAYVRPMR